MTGPSLRTLAELVDRLDRATRILDVDRAAEVARLARAVAHEADRLAAKRETTRRRAA